MQCLAAVTGQERDLWIVEIWKEVYAGVAALSDDEINQLIQDLERNYVPFEERGNALMFGDYDEEALED